MSLDPNHVYQTRISHGVLRIKEAVEAKDEVSAACTALEQLSRILKECGQLASAINDTQDNNTQL